MRPSVSEQEAERYMVIYWPREAAGRSAARKRKRPKGPLVTGRGDLPPSHLETASDVARKLMRSKREFEESGDSPMAEEKVKHTPGPWCILEVMGKRFVAAKPTEDHPYYRKTRHMDVCGDEDYPRKEADMRLSSAAPDLRSSVQEFLDLRDWVIESGGTEGPLSRDVTLKFAEMQNGIIERAKAAIQKAKEGQ